MQKLIQGVHHFQKEIFDEERELFERLSHGQSPDTLFITCSDSRIDPCMLTQSKPGDLFIIRNAGNIIPPYGVTNGGTQATIEYAVSVLGVKHIVVCGHSLCGAVNALLKPESIKDFPIIANWLNHAEVTRRIIQENYADLPQDRKVTAAIEENVLNQIENLCTHPCVAAKLAKKELYIHAWVYKIETGEVFNYDPSEEQFLPLGSQFTPARGGRQTAVPVATQGI